MSRPVVEQYKRLIRESLDIVGVSGSIERKVLAAVGIQFGVSVALAVVAVLFSGGVQFVLTALLLAGAVVAFANTVFITREDMVEPIVTLAERADRIAAGEVDVSVPDSEREDEVASLLAAFAAMQDSLDTVARQADALSQQQFDDPVMDEDVPGTFGESLDRMAENLEAYTAELEALTEDLEARSEALSDLVTAFGDAAGRAKTGDLTASIDAEFDDVDDQFQQVVAD
jgi:methyl-accepting chemotaxis protein